MTRDEVIAMASEAGIEVHDRKQEARFGVDALIGSDSTEQLERFAALVAAKEREACAKACDELGNRFYQFPADCASAIRARGQEAA